MDRLALQNGLGSACEQSLKVRPAVGYGVGMMLLSCILAANLWLSRPLHNWDLIGYIGVVYSVFDGSPGSAHEKTYAEIKRNVPASTYVNLAGATRFRADIANNPEHFSQQIPFYSVKPLYPLLMLALNHLGADLVSASVLISSAAYFAIGLLLFTWIARYYSPLAAFTLTSLVSSFSFVLALANYSTPDGLSAFILLLAFFLFIETDRPRLAQSLLVMSITVRPDNIILAAIIITYQIIVDRRNRWFSLGAILAAAALYLLLAKLSGNYGWKTLFYHSFISRLVSPATQAAPMSASEYINVLIVHSIPAAMRASYSLLLFVALGIVALHVYAYGKQFAEYSREKGFAAVVAALLFSAVHWLIFPKDKERLLAGVFLILLALLIVGVRAQLARLSHAIAPHAKAERETDEVRSEIFSIGANTTNV